MPALVTFLIGRAHTGKSAYIESALRSHREKGERATLLVPEQFTFDTERQLTRALSGLVGIQVLSFDRLSERVLSLAGYRVPFLSRQGLAMIVRRAAISRHNELVCFSRAAGAPGFSADIADVLSSFMRAGVDAGALKSVLPKLRQDTLLYQKLSDLSLLYESVSAFMADQYIASDDAVRTAASALPDVAAQFGHIYIDGFETAGNAALLLLSALFSAAKSVTISLLLPAGDCRDNALFAPNARNYETLLALAGDRGCRVRTVPFEKPLPGRSACAAFLEENLYAYPTKRFPGPSENVRLLCASNREAETLLVADEIVSLSRGGLPYSEMSALVSDLDAYGPLLMRALSLRGVPAFLDRPEPLSVHAGSRALLSSLRAAVLGFLPADVLAAAKSGFFPAEADDVDCLDNYCLQYGVRPGMLSAPLLRAAEHPAAERARLAVVSPLLSLREALAARPVSDKVRALYAFMRALSLEKRLSALAEQALFEGRAGDAARDAQTFARLTELLAQMDAILGDVPMGREPFLALFEEGLHGRAVSAVPPSEECVLVGDLDRTRSRAVGALFVLGVNDGLLPRPLADDELISDSDLAILADTALPVWQDKKRLSEADALTIYSALSKAERRLYMSFSFSGGGSELSPSPLFSRILELFPASVPVSDVGETRPLPETEETALLLLSRLLSDPRGGEADGALLSALSTCLLSREKTRALTRNMQRAADAPYAALALPRDAANALYGRKLSLSASRLETYNLCAFRHFLQYGLAAGERPVWQERSLELGSFYHAAMDAFIKRALSDGVDFSAFTPELADSVMDAVLPEVIASHNGGILLSDPRVHASLFLLVETVRQSARAVAAHFCAGSFTPLGAELRFGDGGAFPAIRVTLPNGTEAALSGVIDRADADGETGAVRVVDYKTHGKSFDLFSVAEGLSLQLPLYLSAAAARHTPAGLYYMPLAVPAPTDGSDVSESLKKAFRLRGLTLSDEALIPCTERVLTGASSVVYGLRRNADGALSGPLVTESEMETLLHRARDVSKNTVSRMCAGDIGIYPYEGACEYCPYRSCCRFDPAVPRCRAKKRRTLPREAFFDAENGGVE